MKSKSMARYFEGIGVDIENIVRFKELNRDKNQKFLNKICKTKIMFVYCVILMQLNQLNKILIKTT